MSSVTQAAFAVLCSADQARDLVNASFLVKAAHEGFSPVIFNAFFNQIVGIAQRSNLRKVGYAQNLSVACDTAHLFADHLRL